MTDEYTAKLIDLGEQLASAARARVEAGDIRAEDVRLISVASYTAGFLEALRIGSAQADGS